MRDWRAAGFRRCALPESQSQRVRPTVARAGEHQGARHCRGNEPVAMRVGAYNFVSLNSFTTLGLAEPLLRALDKARYIQPTPIQTTAIPHLLAGRDLLGVAQTGTGKTAAFVPAHAATPGRQARPATSLRHPSPNPRPDTRAGVADRGEPAAARRRKASHRCDTRRRQPLHAGAAHARRRRHRGRHARPYLRPDGHRRTEAEPGQSLRARRG